MKINIVKVVSIAIFGLFGLFLFLGNEKAAGAMPLTGDDEAAIYKAKCAMCHGQKAEKAFDVAMTDEEMVTAILDGKKGEKPPYMPAFKEKGIDQAKAQALVAHMRGLKNPPAE